MKRIFILYFLILLSCNKEESQLINLPPSDFEVTILSNSYLDTQISWSQSFDPEKGTIKYSIYLNDKELVNNLSIRNHSLNSLKPSTKYSGKVVAIDSENNTTSKIFSFTTPENLPPANFSIISATPSNISIDLNWTTSFDPENEKITYDIYVDENLITANLQQTYYIIKNLNVSTKYKIKIVAKDKSFNTRELSLEKQTLDGIYNDNLSFTSQQSIDNFGKLGYIEINGNVEIFGFLGSSDIHNLSGLGSIKKVTGNFDIRHLDELNSLSGLNIEFIGKSFRIKNNNNLLTLNGLNKLTKIYGSFEIEQNSHLKSITNINNLTIIGGYLKVDNNINLKEIIGFDNLMQTDYIYINSNWFLNDLIGFKKIESLGHISIQNNTSLTNFCTLKSLVDNQDLNTRYFIINNGFNPTKEEIANGNCKL